MFLVKLPFRVAALPVILALTVVQFITSLLVGLSSIVTNLLGTLGISTAACIWMFRLGTDADAYGMLALGIFFIVLPHVAGWMIGKVTEACTRLIAFIVP